MIILISNQIIIKDIQNPWMLDFRMSTHIGHTEKTTWCHSHEIWDTGSSYHDLWGQEKEMDIDLYYREHV